MPGAEVEAVVAAFIRARILAEVFEVRPAVRGQIVVIAGGRVGARLVAPPRRIVATFEFRIGSAQVCVIAQREDRPFDTVEQRGRGARAGQELAVGDVTRPDEDDVFRRRGLRRCLLGI